MTEKRCAMCEELKPLEDYYHYKGRPISYCDPCNKEYHRQQYQRTKGKPKTSKVAGTKLTLDELEELGPQLRGMVLEVAKQKSTKN